ncbi:hypothetical protein GQ43DRAFT_6208 [Delitschia confertaspora ATCC 74209]|uniref:Vacuolar protein sorting-associated protein 62 n=1 Tax=Delitschia confertaspora ATCC 74209 TaxID=1513339 RepID=A0A9P4MZS3_9PLEO|nr:hypothetical protein GQ43DRAFT_6208 [Delitschia confertaspora ATCC 74209]
MGIVVYRISLAPLSYLFSGEKYFPSDIGAQLSNTVPQVNYAAVPNSPNPLDLNNLNSLGADVYLTSKDDITKNPAWLTGVKPDASGKTNDAVSAAVIVNDKGNGVVDAFYMYFFAYDWGGTVLGITELNFGNHVGDWEHNMIRFKDGKPQHVWYSQHANGQAFSYSTVQKNGLRPINYIANGTHANYAIPGAHDHVIPNFNLPGGVLEDHTDAGFLFDPLLSAYFYSYNPTGPVFTPYPSSNPADSPAPAVNWLYFKGRWGDQEYPESDKRQFKLFGQARYASGPTGPGEKQLNRTEVCPSNGNRCILRTILVPRGGGEGSRE